MTSTSLTRSLSHLASITPLINEQTHCTSYRTSARLHIDYTSILPCRQFTRFNQLPGVDLPSKMDRKPAGHGPGPADTEPGYDTIDWAKVVAQRDANSRQDSTALSGRQDSNAQPAAAQPTNVQPATAQPANAPSASALPANAQPVNAEPTTDLPIPNAQLTDIAQPAAAGAAPAPVLDGQEREPRPSEEIRIATGQQVSPQESREHLSHSENEVTGRVPPADSPPDSDLDDSAPVPVPDDEGMEPWRVGLIEQLHIATRRRQVSAEEPREHPRGGQDARVWRNAHGGGARTSESPSHGQGAPVWQNGFGGSARTSNRHTEPSRRASSDVGPSGERTSSAVDRDVAANTERALRGYRRRRNRQPRSADVGASGGRTNNVDSNSTPAAQTENVHPERTMDRHEPSVEHGNVEPSMRRSFRRTDLTDLASAAVQRPSSDRPLWESVPAEKTTQYDDSSTDFTTSRRQLQPNAPIFTPEASAAQPPTQSGDSDSQPTSPLTNRRSSLAGYGRRSSAARSVHFWDEIEGDNAGEGPSTRRDIRGTRDRSQSDLGVPTESGEALPRDDYGHYWINPSTGTK